MSEERFARIRALIEENGAMGVNAIQRELGIPLTTLHKYLERQHFFVKNAQRKWDLPDRVTASVKNNTAVTVVNGLESAISILKAQLADMNNTVLMLSGAANTVKRGIADSVNLPVAEADDLPPIMQDMLRLSEMAAELMKTYGNKFTPENKELILNTDWVTLAIKLGSIYVNDVVNKNFVDIVSGVKTVLDDAIIDVLTEYQDKDEELE